ncbi:hypothetical protein V6N12_070962 [Hibiscus sabdariffa]|uniref:Uncharacterized protein n=1 Tax=Hibiscus sabdariffa TaxID=183260 RepID=A0ABR2FIF7_9ROSI
MPTLSFTREYFAVKHAKRAEFVNETLRRFTGPKIINFLVNFKFDDSMNASVEEWVLFATTRRVEKLSLIFDGGLTSEAIENVLSGSPNLQKLKLHNCGGVNRICSMSLETLEVDAIYEPHEKNESVTEISCPNLQSLSLSGYMYKRTFRVMHVSSLSKANLSFVMTIDKKDKYDCAKHRSILRDLLEKLCHVEKLTVGTW